MKTTAILLLAALPLTGTAAFAQGAGHGQGASDCPPGLAKKSPACQPPGQAKKQYERFEAGDRPSHYERLDRPNRYGLSDNNDYVVSNGNVYRINEQTGEIIAFIDALANLTD